jgi:peptide/nickel transport system substrate-binding protein
MVAGKVVAIALLLVLAAGCAAPAARVGDAGSQPVAPAPSRESRALVAAIRFEPNDLSPKIITRGGSEAVKRPVNAAMALIDAAGGAFPYLAEALPQLHTASWQVFPDGRMETTYPLRRELTWHDGRPLTAEDFVFAWQVYSAPGLGVFNPKPQDQIQEVAAPDPATVLIRWRAPYPSANTLLQAEESDLGSSTSG